MANNDNLQRVVKMSSRDNRLWHEDGKHVYQSNNDGFEHKIKPLHASPCCDSIFPAWPATTIDQFCGSVQRVFLINQFSAKKKHQTP